MNDTPKALKWGIAAILAGTAAYFIIPPLAKLALDLMTIAACGVGLFAMVMLLPAISEWLAQGSYWMWSKAISTNPVQKLWRELKEFGEEIDKVNENINLVATEETAVRNTIAQNRSKFNPDEIMEMNDEADKITEAKMFLMQERDDLKVMFVDMKKEVEKNEARWKIGNALVRASKAVDKAGKISTGTDGARLAFDTINTRLAEGQARLNVLRSNRSVAEIREAMAARKNPAAAALAAPTAPVVVPMSTRRSLTHEAVPTISGITAQVNANNDKVQSILDRI